jgi:hypothetical protein
MKKAEIIAQILEDIRSISTGEKTDFSDEPDYEEIVIGALEASLKEIEGGKNIRTCSDFGHLNVHCCETCHFFYPHYEMSLVDLEDGGNAWICCAMDRVLNPQRRSRLESSAEYKMLEMIFGGNDQD